MTTPDPVSSEPMDRATLARTLRKHAFKGSDTHSTGTGQEVHGKGGEGQSPATERPFDKFVHTSDGGKTTHVYNMEIFEGVQANPDIPQSMVDLGGLMVPSYTVAPALGRPDLPEGEFWVIKTRQGDLERKVARLGRKAERLGYDPLRLTPTGRTHIWEDSAGWMGGKVVEFQSFKLEGESPYIPGYEFAAKLEHIEGPDGKYINLLKKNPNFEGDIPKKYRDAGPNCDQCKRNIYRRDTFVIRNTETGEWKQLGRDDLRTYTGSDKFESVIEYDSLFMENMDMYGQPDDDFMGGRGGGGEYTIGTRTYLAYAVAAIEEDGRYIKTSEVGMSTRDHVLEALNPRNDKIKLNVTEAHFAKADQIAEWIDDLEAGDSDYLWNLKVAMQHNALDRRMFGIVSSAPAAYTRELERRLSFESLDSDDSEGPSFLSEFVGEPKERLRGLELTVTRTNSFEGDYGTTFVYNMRDDSGNSFVWFASNPPMKVDVAAAEKARQQDIAVIKEGERLFKEKLVPAGVAFEGVVGMMGSAGQEAKLKEAGKLTEDMVLTARAAMAEPWGLTPLERERLILTESAERNQVFAYARERLAQGKADLDLDKVTIAPEELNSGRWNIGLEPGDKFSIDITVKDHKIDTFGGANEKQTVLTRGNQKSFKYLGKVETDEKGMPLSLGRRGRNKLALPYTVQNYTGRWGRAYIPLPPRQPDTPIVFKERIRQRYYSGFEVEYTDADGQLQTIRVEDSEIDLPIDMLAKRGKVKTVLRKHGTAHDESSHGNWARNMSGRQLSDEVKTQYEISGEGGFTVHHPTGMRPEKGFAVAVPGAEQVVGTVEALTPRHINQYRQTHAAKLAEPDTFLGAWVDTTDGQVYLDISVVFDDRDAAIEYGRSSNQKAIFDLATFEDIRLDDEQRIAARRVPLVMT